jgi:hypothetical protein
MQQLFGHLNINLLQMSQPEAMHDQARHTSVPVHIYSQQQTENLAEILNPSKAIKQF